MPHIIVEHTRDVEGIPDLLRALHNSLGHQDTVQIESLKTRAICLDHVVIGDGDTQSMIHVTLRLLPGRGDELLKKMTMDLEGIAKNYCPLPHTRVTVEVVELHQASYQN
jgi:5-carboxymethyl-2-hydroxymuconate isomerase